MLDSTFRKAGKWWPIACFVLITAGGLGLLLLPIDWPLVGLILEAIQQSVRFLGQALGWLSYDLKFTVSALAILLGTVALGFYVVWRFRRLVDPKADTKPKEESTVGVVVKVGWPVLALVIAFIIAVARGESYQFLQEAAKEGITFSWIFLVVMVVAVGILVWVWWSSSGSELRNLFFTTGAVRRLNRKLEQLLKHFGLTSPDAISDKVKDAVCVAKDKRAIKAHQAETGMDELQAREAITNWVTTGLEQKVDLVLKHLDNTATVPVPQERES